jgi:5-formyltetrahydrofolate cyclo-ligase
VVVSSPPETKASLRRALRERRATLKHQRPDAALKAAQAFAAVLPSLGSVKTASIYHPFGTELDPYPLAAVLRRGGVEIALPVVAERDAPLVFRILRDGDAMHPDAAGIMTAGPDSPEVRPDLVAAPLLGFDATGARLGQGGGYYDRTLQALRASGPPVLFIGLAYAGQEAESLPADELDQRLDAILTEDGFRRFSR